MTDQINIRARLEHIVNIGITDFLHTDANGDVTIDRDALFDPIKAIAVKTMSYEAVSKTGRVKISITLHDQHQMLRLLNEIYAKES